MLGFARSYHQVRQEIKDGTFRANFSTRYLPSDVAAAYLFPPGSGKGQVIGLIELGGGFTQAGVKACFDAYNLRQQPKVLFQSVDGGTNTPDGPNGADGEVMLDIGVAGCVAPGSTIVVFTSPNTEQGFVNCITAARKYGCTQISISWGAPEKQWSSSAITKMNNEFQACANDGITVLVASGDNGSTDGIKGNNVDFPASSPFVTGCGGTALTASSEQVWNNGAAGGATGGGSSNLFVPPSYQSNIPLPAQKRGVPDVSGNADPQQGYLIVVDGQTMVIGGTSAVSPLWAGLGAILNESLNKRLGFLNPLIYSLGGKGFKDITTGNNGTYTAKQGYDLCTGWGSPNGKALLVALGGAAPAPPVPVPPQPVPTPTPTPTPTPVSHGTITVSKDLKAGTYPF